MALPRTSIPFKESAFVAVSASAKVRNPVL
jgi:hypothetical protein